MELLTKELKERFAKYPIYSQDGKAKDAICIAKFFHPLSCWTWYALEYDKETNVCFGIVVGFDVEYGDFSMDELQNVTAGGLGVERDMYFKPCRVGDIEDPDVQGFLNRLYGKSC